MIHKQNEREKKMEKRTIEFRYLKQDDFEVYSIGLFQILYENMSKIAPTGDSYEEDYKYWFDANKDSLKQDHCYTIICIQKDTSEVLGYFQYSIRDDVFVMEEIQIKDIYQGKYQIFEEIYKCVFENMKEQVAYVEAYANKKNTKSQGILKKLGLTIVGENKRGTSYHFRGTYSDLLKWYYKSNKQHEK